MHKCYIASGEDIAAAFGTRPVENANTNGRQNTSDDAAAAQMLDFPYGEGRCPVVPLVFKTSLGAVRFPEGSTPSLLRHDAQYLTVAYVRNTPSYRFGSASTNTSLIVSLTIFSSRVWTSPSETTELLARENKRRFESGSEGVSKLNTNFSLLSS